VLSNQLVVFLEGDCFLSLRFVFDAAISLLLQSSVLRIKRRWKSSDLLLGQICHSWQLAQHLSSFVELQIELLDD